MIIRTLEALFTLKTNAVDFRKATSQVEIERHWAIDDVADAHQVLDYFAHLEYLEMRQLRKS